MCYEQMLLQIGAKQAGYCGMAEYFQSLVCKNSKLIGEEIARLEVSCRCCKAYSFFCKFLSSIVRNTIVFDAFSTL